MKILWILFQSEEALISIPLDINLKRLWNKCNTNVIESALEKSASALSKHKLISYEFSLQSRTYIFTIY